MKDSRLSVVGKYFKIVPVRILIEKLVGQSTWGTLGGHLVVESMEDETCRFLHGQSIDSLLNSSMVQFHPAPPRASTAPLLFHIFWPRTQNTCSQYVILLGYRYR